MNEIHSLWASVGDTIFWVACGMILTILLLFGQTKNKSTIISAVYVWYKSAGFTNIFETQV